ncbi:MAG: Alpha-glucosidase [Chitinophagaceae bacterium]|nr:Alpha-glucosidase [Chitinophagaceae bacterium]
MKKVIVIFFLFVSAIALKAQTYIITSPRSIVKAEFSLKRGHPEYQVYFKDKAVIKSSSMGFELKESPSLKDLPPMKDNFLLSSVDSSLVNETWQPVWGEVKIIRNNYRQYIFHLIEKDDQQTKLDIVFRVFDDGVGFRYEFPAQKNLTVFVISDELTQFHVTGNHKAFWIPGDYDSNEFQPVTSSLSEVDAASGKDVNEIAFKTPINANTVQTPLMMKTTDGLYLNIHEAALVDYPAMNLSINKSNYVLSSTLVPDALGSKAYLIAPAKTPWRTIIVSDKATDILASKMILNLNEPSKIKNTSWIKPMKFVGVWWEMHVGKSTWDYAGTQDGSNAKDLKPSGRHGATTKNVKRYIDFAAKNKIDGVLVEGWNTGWEDWFGKWKENVFDFVTPYPDFDVKEIQRYAASKNVKMIMHNETSGAVTSYERQMDTAYRFMKKFGYPAVKTGYVGRIIPRGEHHDGQWMVNHYIRVAEKTASYNIMVDMHEPVRPTGLQRTYPNWLACEAARGNEFNAWSKGNNPDHETILPFTRLMGGPMDYTPGIFQIKLDVYDPKKTEQVHTTLAKQLALYITMYSPLQMAADLPENYEAHMDAFQFIKDVAVDWDDTKIIEAEPGDYITIARKAKGKSDWFVGSITDENKREANINLNFLDKGKKYMATIYADGKDADWKNNPMVYLITRQTVDSKSALSVNLAPGGGCAISLIQIK